MGNGWCVCGVYDDLQLWSVLCRLCVIVTLPRMCGTRAFAALFCVWMSCDPAGVRRCIIVYCVWCVRSRADTWHAFGENICFDTPLTLLLYNVPVYVGGVSVPHIHTISHSTWNARHGAAWCVLFNREHVRFNWNARRIVCLNYTDRQTHCTEQKHSHIQMNLAHIIPTTMHGLRRW